MYKRVSNAKNMKTKDLVEQFNVQWNPEMWFKLSLGHYVKSLTICCEWIIHLWNCKLFLFDSWFSPFVYNTELYISIFNVWLVFLIVYENIKDKVFQFTIIHTTIWNIYNTKLQNIWSIYTYLEEQLSCITP